MNTTFERNFFIYPKGSSTVINMLAGTLSAKKASIQLCKDMQERFVWECPDDEFVESFIRNARRNHLEFDIYVREHPDAPLTLWPYVDTVTIRSHLKSSVKLVIAKKSDAVWF